MGNKHWHFLVMLTSPHPCPGWLHRKPQDSRKLFGQQLTLRDHALEADPSFSDMPTESNDRNPFTTLFACRLL